MGRVIDEIEGLWEEVRGRDAELARKHVRVQVMDEPDAPGKRPLSPAESIRLLNELAERSRGLPVLPPEAFERESIYEDY